MSWVRIDASFYGHPKFVGLPPQDIGVWLCFLAYCAHYLTDGVVDKKVATRLVPDSRGLRYTIARLVATRLLADRGSHWEVVSYLEWNPSKADVERQKKANAERQNRFRNADSNALRNASVTLPTIDIDKDININPLFNPPLVGSANASPAASKTQPQKTKAKPKPKKPKVMPHSIPDDFALSPERLAWCTRRGWGETEARQQFGRFKAHYQAKGGEMVSWDKAFVTWILKAEQWDREKQIARAAGYANGAPAPVKPAANGVNHVNGSSQAPLRMTREQLELAQQLGIKNAVEIVDDKI